MENWSKTSTDIRMATADCETSKQKQCTKEILQAVPKNAKVFAKLDAVHGYFQLGLDEASSKITTFLLPQGKFMKKWKVHKIKEQKH